METKFCKTCGGALAELDGGRWECKYCKNVYNDESVKKEADMLRTLLGEQKTEQVSNLRRNLYDAINEKYNDSEQIIRICGDIKALLPDDFMANFYYTANHGTPKEICRAIGDIDSEENISYVDGIVAHIASSMRSEYVLPLQNLVERAYKNTDMTKFEQLSTLISDEAEKVNAGIYETGVPRDVFVAYSSRDMAKVEELVAYLEANGVDCFVAARNLRHGRGAVQNYEKALHEAIENCGCVVFVSSKNSRSMECDALKVELKYIKNTDIINAPAEYRKNYLTIPQRYKMNRIEYRIDNEHTQPYAEKVVSEFFSGLEFAYSPEEVIDRIYNFDTDLAPEQEAPTNAEEPREEVKYCTACGEENKGAAKFCFACGGSEFVATYKEYELAKELSEMKRKMQEEEKRREEEKKKEAEKVKRSGIFVYTLRDDGTYGVAAADRESLPANVTIPRTFNGKPVTYIGTGAFSQCKKLRSMTIPDSIKYIDKYAFTLCHQFNEIIFDGTSDDWNKLYKDFMLSNHVGVRCTKNGASEMSETLRRLEEARLAEEARKREEERKAAEARAAEEARRREEAAPKETVTFVVKSSPNPFSPANGTIYRFIIDESTKVDVVAGAKEVSCRELIKTGEHRIRLDVYGWDSHGTGDPYMKAPEQRFTLTRGRPIRITANRPGMFSSVKFEIE